jgi:hypothetical protein
MIKNPRTNRLIKIGSQMHKKAINDGILSPETLKQDIPTPTDSSPIQTDIIKEPEINIPTEFTVEKGVAEICTDIIADNKKTFNKLNQQETNELLRKLLYEKLYINVPENIGKQPKQKHKEKEKSKPKLKLKKYYSSSSESD